MAKMTRRLYAIASKCGLVERDNKDDALHQIIFSITGKTSAKELTAKEIKAVEAEILERYGNEISGNKIKNQEAVEGMMPPAQQSLAWRYMYEIKSYDLKQSDKTVDERLAGVVRKELGITASGENPLVWVDAKDGNRLIEALKRYAASAERKYIRQRLQK
ncbi:MAG: regulatory protein GemA [Ruminococcus sp.]|nr:regulatory protein GemA [Ruminococcus sp.]